MYLAPVAAFGQSNNQGRLVFTVDNVHIVPATDDQIIRVTIGSRSENDRFIEALTALATE